MASFRPKPTNMHGAGGAVHPVHGALHGAHATRGPAGKPGVAEVDRQRVEVEQQAQQQEGGHLVGRTGRDELRHEGQEEQRDLGVEHVGEETAPVDAAQVGRLVDSRGIRRHDGRSPALGEEQLDAHPHQVRGTDPLEHREGRGRSSEQRAHTERCRKHMHEAPADDAQRRHDAGAHAALEGVAHDIEHIGAGREVEQPARRDEHEQLRGVGHGALRADAQ